MLLHNYCQKTYRFAIERFHAMWKFGVKINAVALVEDDFLAFDVDKHTSFEYEVELLTVMLVVMDRLVISFRFNGDDERVGGTVHESGCQRLVFVGFRTFDAGPLAGAGYKVAAHFGFFAEHQGIEGDIVGTGYFLQHTDRNIVFSSFCESVLFSRNVTVSGDILRSQFEYVA